MALLKNPTAQQTLTIRIDTREQDPFTFESVVHNVLQFTTVKGTLRTGDYADNSRVMLPPADQAVIERKSLADLYGTFGRGRDRFIRECKRLSAYGFAALVVEATYAEIADPNWHLKHPTQMSPRAVIKSMLGIAMDYGILVVDCPGRKFAEQATYYMLERWARTHEGTSQEGSPV